MKKLLTLLPGFALLAVLQFTLAQSASAQQEGTKNSGLTLRVTINGVSTDYNEFECGYGAADWGGVVTEDICAPATWARDYIGNDSLVCDSIPVGSLTGKIALVRRGACGAAGTPQAAAGTFAAKALNAQRAGAVAVLVANHSTIAGQTDCFVQPMSADAPLVTIPALFICRAVANQINAAFNAGQTVEICLLRPEAFMNTAFYPVSSGQTPTSQIAKDTFGFSVNLTNTRGNTLSNVVVDAKVQTTAGVDLYSTSLTIPSLTGDVADSLFILPGLFAPELPIGNYRIVYTTNATGSLGPLKDVRRYFFNVTERLWSKDVSGPQIGFRPGTIPDAGWAVGNVYELTTGSLDNYVFRTVEFSNSTPTELPITDVLADIYLFQVKDDVPASYTGFATADLFSTSLLYIGTGTYDAPANATQFGTQQAELTDILSAEPGVPVQNGKRYFLVMGYTGSSRVTFHSFNQDHIIPGIGTVTYSTQWFLGGFQGDPTAVLRVYLDLALTTDNQPLPDNTMQILPNPIHETLNLGFTFDESTDATITIADMSGRVIKFEDRKLTTEMVSYQLPELASGTYLARVATKQGTLTKKFVVQK
jgi:hypothetical protein